MSYTPTTWQSGDLISSEKLNKMEQGIANSGGGALIVHGTEDGEGVFTLDKTWQEIYSAAQSGCVFAVAENNGRLYPNPLYEIGEDDGDYILSIWDYPAQDAIEFVAESPSSYPHTPTEPGN